MRRYFIQRWIFFNKNATLEPLYHFETSVGQSQIDEMHANDKARAERNANAARGSGSDGEVPQATEIELERKD